MNITIKKTAMVKPASQTAKHVIWCSNVDLVISMMHTPTVYFYEQQIQGSNPNAFSFEHLKESLSQALDTFYPLAGRLFKTESGRYEIDCNAEGVLLVEAIADGSLSYYGDHFAPSTKMRQLVPMLDYSLPIGCLPILILQVTFFNCGGVSLGVGIQHVVCDGMSALRFMNFWGEIARGLQHKNIKPFLDRTIMKARDPPIPKFDHLEYQPTPPLTSLDHNNRYALKLLSPNTKMLKEINENDHNNDGNIRSEVEELSKLAEDVHCECKMLKRPKEHEHNTSMSYDMFFFTKEQVHALKKKARLSIHDPLNNVFTSYEVLAAHIWQCVSKARGLEGTQVSKLYLAIDARKRLQPPLPEEYFGNSVFTTTPIKQIGDIVGSPLGEIVKFIQLVLHDTNDEYLRSSLDYLELQPNITSLARGPHTFKSPNLGVTSWMRLPIYGLNLGWGPPLSMGPAGVPFEGLAYLLPGPPGDTNIRISIALCPNHMDRFRELIYDL